MLFGRMKRACLKLLFREEIREQEATGLGRRGGPDRRGGIGRGLGRRGGLGRGRGGRGELEGLQFLVRDAVGVLVFVVAQEAESINRLCLRHEACCRK